MIIQGRINRKVTMMMYSVLFFLSSCQPHDPFCFHHPHGAVRVEYDWTEAPDAGGVGGTTVHFYRSGDGRRVTTAHFTGREGGSLYLGEGEYDVVACNNDTERIHWRGTDSLPALETYTRDASLTEELPGYSHGPVDGLVLTPDRLWSGHRERVRVSRNDTTVILIVPRKVTYEVIWEVTGVRGAERVTAAAASVSGVGGSLFLDGWQTDRHGTLMSGVGSRLAGSAAKSESDSTGGFSGRFEVFGCPFRDTCRHVFTLYCWSRGGNVKASFDVREQFHVVHEDRKIYIKLKADLEIPNGDGGGSGSSGFVPDVDDWGEVNEDIIL